MKNKVRQLLRILTFFGFDFKKTYLALKTIPFFVNELKEFKRQSKNSVNCNIEAIFPMIGDRFAQKVKVFPEYFYQDLLVANKIFNNKPVKHVDIGSRVDGFVASVAAFREIEVFDIRDLPNIKNVIFKQADFMNVESSFNEYCDSLSCLHALEHFGLGRYGDPICFDGHERGFENMYKILKTKGKFYLSVPIGRQRIEFNAHRFFSLKYLLQLFEGKFILDSFSYIDDTGIFHENVKLDEEQVANNVGCNSGCGIFELSKI